MNDLPERSQFESRLPDDQGYWDDLAGQIVDSSEAVLREYRDNAWWQPLATWSPVIGVAAAAAAIIAVVTIPAIPTSATPTRPSLQQLLSPEDPIAQAVVGGASAASISTMLLVQSGGRP